MAFFNDDSGSGIVDWRGEDSTVRRRTVTVTLAPGQRVQARFYQAVSTNRVLGGWNSPIARNQFPPGTVVA